MALLLGTFAPLAAAQEDDVERVRETWNEVFERSKARGWEWQANEFLAEVVAGLHPGTALDVGIGQGRNSLFLAEQGWRVTGFDLSDEAVAQARAQAEEAGLELTAVQGDVNTFDYGVARWDLVVGMYMHDLVSDQAEAIVRSLKPGGLLVIEAFHRDLHRESVQGGYFGHSSNELLRAFDALRVLHYEDRTAISDWGRGGRNPIVRFVGRKPHPTTDAVAPALITTVPGGTPALIAPDVVNTEAIEFNGVFTDRGREFWFTRKLGERFVMHRMQIQGGLWTEPQPIELLPIEDASLAADMSFSGDGQELVFLGPGERLDLWTARQGRYGWSTARKLPAPVSTAAQELYPCLVGDGSLYFASRRDGGQGGSDVWRAQRREDGGFEAPVNVGAVVNGEHNETDVWVSGDESTMVVTSDRPGGQGRSDLWISFRGDDGAWSPPKNLGPEFNTALTEFCPMGSWDGSVFTFSRRNGESWGAMTESGVYWVDAAALDAFRD